MSKRTKVDGAASGRRTVAAVERARQLAGGTVALGAICGVASQMVSQWLAGVKPVSPRAAVAIELALGVRADHLCELVPWRALPQLQRLRALRARRMGLARRRVADREPAA